MKVTYLMLRQACAHRGVALQDDSAAIKHWAAQLSEDASHQAALVCLTALQGRDGDMSVLSQLATEAVSGGVSILAASRTKQGAAPVRRVVGADMPLLDELKQQPKLHIYRTTTALSVEWGNAGERPGLFLVAANRVEGRFSWPNGLRITLDADEALGWLKVCLGVTEKYEVSHHGPARNHGAEIRANKGSVSDVLMIRLTAPGKAIPVPCNSFELLSLTELLAMAVSHGMPGKPAVPVVIDMVKAARA